MSYPIEIEIDSPHDDVIEELLSELEHSIHEIGDHWKRTENRIVHTADLYDLLAEHRAIGIVWDIEHIKDQRPDLTDEQAWGVLQECQGCYERLNDPMLEIIRQVADNLYPQQRQVRQVKSGEVIASYGNGDERENLVDLLTDTMHWCQALGEPFEEFYGTARLHFDEETKPTTDQGE
jgi:hypothetical protein